MHKIKVLFRRQQPRLGLEIKMLAKNGDIIPEQYTEAEIADVTNSISEAMSDKQELELVSDCCGAKIYSIYDDEPMCSDCCDPCDEVTQDEIKPQN